MIFSQPNNSIQLSVAKYTSEESVNLDDAKKEVTPTLMILAISLFLLITLAAPLIIKVTHLRNLLQVMIGGGVVVIWLITAGYRGAYQGKMNFFVYGLNIGVEGIARALIGIIFILVGFKIKGAIGASIISGITAIFIMVEKKLKFIIHNINIKNWKINTKIIREFIKACSVLIPFGIIIYLDLTMVQFVRSRNESGYLSACSLFGKNLISLSLVVANVVFSYSLKHRGKTLWAGLWLTVIVFLCASITTLFFGDWITYIVFRNNYKEISALLPLYIAANLPLGIMQNFINFSIAKNINSIKILIWVFLAALTIIYYFILKSFSIEFFLVVMMAVAAFMDLILLFIIMKFMQKERLSY